MQFLSVFILLIESQTVDNSTFLLIQLSFKTENWFGQRNCRNFCSLELHKYLLFSLTDHKTFVELSTRSNSIELSAGKLL